MRSLLLLFCLISSIYANAQDFNTLTRRAESLKSSDPKKALALYEKAIDRIVNYKDQVTNHQWLQVSNAAADLTGKMKVPEYDPGRYRIDGEKYTERITRLKTDGVKCIFAYQSFCDGCNGTSYVIDPTKRIPYFPSNEKWLLIWLDGNDIWMQAYGDNIYKPLKMNNKALADFLKAHCKELASQELARSRSKLSDGVTKFRFRFYWDGTTYEKTIANKTDLIDPSINSDKYLTELSPKIQAEASVYYGKIKYAQDVKTLIHEADSLNARSKHKKALKFYDQAIEKVTSYQDTIGKLEWFRICNAAGELAGKNYLKYSPARYFVEGEKYNEKVLSLKQQGSICIFTYAPYDIGGTGIFYVIDPKKKFQFVPSDKQQLMVWIADNDLYMQAFGDYIFKPLKVDNPLLIEFLKSNYDKLPLEELGRQRSIYNHRTEFVFNFYWNGTFYKKSIDQPTSLVVSTQNENTYLGRLLPQIKAEAAKYYDKLKTNPKL